MLWQLLRVVLIVGLLAPAWTKLALLVPSTHPLELAAALTEIVAALLVAAGRNATGSFVAMAFYAVASSFHIIAGPNRCRCLGLMLSGAPGAAELIYSGIFGIVAATTFLHSLRASRSKSCPTVV